MRRFVDISVPLKTGIASDPPGHCPEIDYYDHGQTAEDVVTFIPGATVEDLPDREGWAIERVRITTHNGTHLDAPYHYSSVMDGGARAITIGEVPLEWCLQPAAKLDFRHLEDGYVVTAADVEAELARIGHELSPLEIVLVNTSAGVRYGCDDYVCSGCGMGREATLYLLERGVRLTGTDAWSWDAPFIHTARRYAIDHDPSVIWEGHRAGREIGYCHRDAPRSGVAASRRLPDLLLPGENPRCLGRVDPRRGDLGRPTSVERCPVGTTTHRLPDHGPGVPQDSTFSGQEGQIGEISDRSSDKRHWQEGAGLVGLGSRSAAPLAGIGGSIFIAVAFGAVTVWFEHRVLTLAVGISGGAAFSIGVAIGLYLWTSLQQAVGWHTALTAAEFRTPAGATTLEGVAITRAGLRQALGHRDLWIYGLALLGGYGAYFTTSQLLSEYAVTVRGFTPTTGGLLAALIGLAGIPGSVLGGMWADRSTPPTPAPSSSPR